MKLCHLDVGLDHPFFLMAGPCVIESERLVMETAESLRNLTDALEIPFIFKSSFDKANRSSHETFRGLGIEEGLRILEKVKRELQVPVLTDVHEVEQLPQLVDVVDVLQTPAFLCRQTDFIQKVAATQLPIHIKKAQFMAPWEMVKTVAKAKSVGNETILVCERGTTFGYQNLVVDMRSLTMMRATGCPVVFDVTHSVQLPGALGNASGGQREFVPSLARAACAVGIAGIFMETHPNPDQALSDGPNSWPLHQMEPLLKMLKAIDETVKSTPFLENV